MNLRPLVATLALAVASAFAHDYTAGSLEIGHPHARPTTPSQSIGAGYLKLVNTGAAADRCELFVGDGGHDRALRLAAQP